MPESFRYSDLQRAYYSEHQEASLDDIVPAPERGPDGVPIPAPLETIKLTTAETAALVWPYVSVRFMDQVRSVVPLAIYLALFQLLILNQIVEDSMLITGGLFAVIVGLLFFMEGLNKGLMPLGELIGSGLPRRSPLPIVLFITLLLAAVAPCWIARRITAGSSTAETMTVGKDSWLLRM